MKTNLRIVSKAVCFLLLFGSFWVSDGWAQVKYTINTTRTFSGNNLKHPTGLAVEPGTTEGECGGIVAPMLWIADTGHNIIRVFNTTGGYLCTIAGDGNAG